MTTQAILEKEQDDMVGTTLVWHLIWHWHDNPNEVSMLPRFYLLKIQYLI